MRNNQIPRCYHQKITASYGYKKRGKGPRETKEKERKKKDGFNKEETDYTISELIEKARTHREYVKDYFSQLIRLSKEYQNARRGKK